MSKASMRIRVTRFRRSGADGGAGDASCGRVRTPSLAGAAGPHLLEHPAAPALLAQAAQVQAAARKALLLEALAQGIERCQARAQRTASNARTLPPRQRTIAPACLRTSRESRAGIVAEGRSLAA